VAESALSLEATPVLGGTDLTLGENRVRQRDDLALVSVATPLDGEDALASALDSGWGLSMPGPTVSSIRGETRAIRTGPDQILLVFPHGTHGAEALVKSKLDGAGYTTDQSDALVALEISGPETLPALERLCPLDTASMPENAAARTVMEHMGAMILRLGPDRFLLLSASSSARSFLDAVETSYRYVAKD